MAEAGGVSVPDYDELPLHEALGMRHAWGVFGDADELGTLNHMGPAERVAAREEIREGRTFNLSLPLDLPKPAMFGRRGYTHHVFSSARNIQDDSLDSFYPQASSQWDALRHVRAREFGFYNGVPEEEAGAEGERLGIDRFAEYGVVGRAALLDVARYLEEEGRAMDPGGTYRIRVEDLEGARRSSGVEVRPGDVLLIRTGWLAAYLASDQAGREEIAERLQFPGLHAGEATARYLWNLRISAVVADNPAVEWAPGDREDGSLHRRLIPMLGMAMGEMWNLEGLAAHSAEDARYTAFLASVPLNLPRGVGSPANAVCLK